MRRGKIYILIAVGGLMMLALVIVQLLWLRSEFAANRKAIDLRVSTCMQSIAEEISTDYHCAPTYSKAFIDAGEKVYLIRTKRDGQLDTLQLFYDEKYTEDNSVGRLDHVGFYYPFKLEATLNAIITNSGNEAYWSGRKKRFESAKQNNQLEQVISNARPIDSILEMEVIQALIKERLWNEEIDTQFSFGFVQQVNSSLGYISSKEDSAFILQTPFRTAVFKANPFMQNYFLHLHIPQLYKQNRITWFHLLPLLIILALLIALSLFARLFFKQIHLNNLKSNFIHNVAHELNTPLANIALALETLDGENVTENPKAKTLLGIISAESSRLHENIEKSLHFARMENGNFRLQREVFDIVDLVNTVLISHRYKCQELGGDIYFDQQAPIELLGDETHILNCIVNVLDNAIKYRSDKPLIYITIRELRDTVDIEIRDNGIGMNASTVKHIFDKFYRADEGSEHNTRGFGLGLSYVSNIVNLHGGKVLVQSKVGEGSTFTLRFNK